jgi:hypothetical protein
VSRGLLAAAVAGCASAIAIAGCGATAEPTAAPRAPAAQARVAAGAGISLRLPRGWQLTTPPITALTSPAERLLLTSYPARRGGNCAPDRAERALPAGGALVYLFEYRSGHDVPPRPAHFALRRGDLGTFECWRVPTYLIRFRAAGRPFQVHVALGAKATAARRAEVLRALDSLRIAPPPPPKPTTFTARQLEAALRANPNSEARSAACTPAGSPQRRRARHAFGRTRLPLFVCAIALGRRGAETFDVQVLRSGCFVAERRRPGQADVGCIRR